MPSGEAGVHAWAHTDTCTCTHMYRDTHTHTHARTCILMKRAAGLLVQAAADAAPGSELAFGGCPLTWGDCRPRQATSSSHDVSPWVQQGPPWDYLLSSVSLTLKGAEHGGWGVPSIK